MKSGLENDKSKEDLHPETYRLFCKRLMREQMEINLV